MKEIYESLLNNTIDASIVDLGLAEYITNNVHCNLTLVGPAFGRSAYGIVFRKNWQYKKVIDVNILALRESGILDDLSNQWFGGSSCSQLSSRTNAMAIESMAGLFLTFGIICTLSILLSLWQNRLIMKDYLLTLIYRKSRIDENDVPSINNSHTTSSEDSSS